MAIDQEQLDSNASFLAAVDSLSGGKLAQYVKLLVGTDGSEQPILGNSSGELFTIDTGARAELVAILAKLNAGVGITGSFWQATQPVSAATLPLPAGAATAANQATEISGLGALLTELQQKTEPTDTQPVSIAATVAVSAAALPLPTGAATAALQPALVAGRTPVDPSGVTSPVSVAALPLPAGAATSALQPALVAGRTPVDPSGVTSPISAAALPLPAGAATSALQPALVGGRTPVDPSGVTSPVSVAGTVAVSAAALPLPSGAATAALQPALVGGRTPVDPSGVTSPVSLAALPALAAGAAVIGALTANQTVDVAKINGVTPLMGAGNTGTGSPRVVISTDQPVLTTAFPSNAKGVQGATGLATQDLKDAGRQSVALVIDAYQTAFVAETLIGTMQSSIDCAAASTGLSEYVVPSGKRLRITSLLTQLSTVTGNTTTAAIFVRFRATTGAGVSTASPMQGKLGLPGGNTANIVGGAVSLVIPDGLEFPENYRIGVTAACPLYVVTTAAPLVSVWIIGYLY